MDLFWQSNVSNLFWNVTYIILRFCSTSVWILFPQWDVSGFWITSSPQCAETGSLDYFFYQVVNFVFFLKLCLLPHHSSKASILLPSTFFIVQFSHPYMTTGKTIALTKWTFVGKVMSLFLNMLVITFLPRSKRLLISWLQSPSAVILEPPKK